MPATQFETNLVKEREGGGGGDKIKLKQKSQRQISKHTTIAPRLTQFVEKKILIQNQLFREMQLAVHLT